MDRSKEFIQEFLLWPIVGSCTTASGVLAGFLGSLYAQRIMDQTYFALMPGRKFELAPTMFWVSAFIFVALFGATVWAQNRSHSQTNGEFKASLRALFTMPSRGFLLTYERISLASTTFIWQLPNSLQVADVERAVRFQLECICSVVKEYDVDGNSAAYGCNVMLFIPAGSAQFVADEVALQARTNCIETGVAISNLAGVLDLQLPLSIRSSTSISPDTTLTAMALPIPHLVAPQTNASQNYDNVVPGAPYAFLSGKALVFRSQMELIEEIQANRNFSTTVVNSMTALLSAQAAHVQALICIPLFPSMPPANPPQAGTPPAPSFPLGVVNIHRNLPDLHAAAKFEYLSPLLAPMVQNLGNLVKLLP